MSFEQPTRRREAWDTELGSVRGHSAGDWAQQAADDAVELARAATSDALRYERCPVVMVPALVVATVV